MHSDHDWSLAVTNGNQTVPLFHSNPWKTFLCQIAKINIFRKKPRKYIHHLRLTHHFHLCPPNVVCVFNTMLTCFHVDITSISPYHIPHGGHRACPWVIGSATAVNGKYHAHTTIAIPFSLYKIPTLTNSTSFAL